MGNFILQNTEPITTVSEFLTSNIKYDGSNLTNIPATTNGGLNTILTDLNSTLGSFASSFAGITGTGTKLAKFTGASTIGDSLLTEAAKVVTLGGTTSTLNEFKVNDSAKEVSLGVRGSGHSSGVTANGAQADAFIITGAGINGLNIIKNAGGGSEADYLRFYAGNTPTSTSRIHITGKTSGASEIGNIGINQEVPDKRLEVLDTATQLRLTHTNASKFVDFTVDTNHDLLVKPSSTGQIKLQPTTDSVDFFQVLDADGGVPVFNVDATNERVGIGIAAPTKQFHIEGAVTQEMLLNSTSNDSIFTLKSANAKDSILDFNDVAGDRWMIGTNNALSDAIVFADGTTLANSTRLALTRSNGGVTSTLQFYEGGATPAHYMGIKAPDAVTASKTLVLPDGHPTLNGQVLSSTALGIMSWVDNMIIYVTTETQLMDAFTHFNNVGVAGTIKMGADITLTANRTLDFNNGIELIGGGHYISSGATPYGLTFDGIIGAVNDIVFNGTNSLDTTPTTQNIIKINSTDMKQMTFDNCWFSNVAGHTSASDGVNDYQIIIENSRSAGLYIYMRGIKITAASSSNDKPIGPFKIKLADADLDSMHFFARDWHLAYGERNKEASRFEASKQACLIKFDNYNTTEHPDENQKRKFSFDDSVGWHPDSFSKQRGAGSEVGPWLDLYPTFYRTPEVTTVAGAGAYLIGGATTGAGISSYQDVSNRSLIFTSGSATTPTIQPDSDLTFPIDSEMEISNHNTGACTITRGSGVALYVAGIGNANYVINEQYGSVKIKKYAANTWKVITSDVALRTNHATSAFITMGSGDTSPDISGGTMFKTHSDGVTIDQFDGGVCGQVITIISGGATVYDVTSSELKGGTTNITTAAGDVTTWACESATVWHLISWMDLSQDLSGAGGF